MYTVRIDEGGTHVELHERIDRALAELTRGEGLTPANVEGAAPWLIDALGVKNAQEAHDLIRSTLEELDWSSQYENPSIAHWGQQHNRALLNAFGGEGLPQKVAERRKRHARRYGVTVANVRAGEKKARMFLADTLARIAEARGK